MFELAETTQNTIDLLETGNLLEAGEQIVALEPGNSPLDVVTIQMGERDYILFACKKTQGVVVFPYSRVLEGMGYDDRSFSDPTGDNRESFLSTVKATLDGLRRGEQDESQRMHEIQRG